MKDKSFLHPILLERIILINSLGANVQTVAEREYNSAAVYNDNTEWVWKEGDHGIETLPRAIFPYLYVLAQLSLHSQENRVIHLPGKITIN